MIQIETLIILDKFEIYVSLPLDIRKIEKFLKHKICYLHSKLIFVIDGQ